jgi:hypothetical protein
MEEVSQETKIKELTFKEFIDKTVNLLTVFAIFNGLTIYSASIGVKSLSVYLSMMFLGLSILIWFELLSYTISFNQDNYKFHIFNLTTLLIEFALIGYFLYTYAGFVYLICVFGIFLALLLLFRWVTTGIAANLFILLFRKDLKKKPETKETKLRWFTFIWIIILMAPSTFLARYTVVKSYPYIGPFIEERLNALMPIDSTHPKK